MNRAGPSRESTRCLRVRCPYVPKCRSSSNRRQSWPPLVFPWTGRRRGHTQRPTPPSGHFRAGVQALALYVLDHPYDRLRPDVLDLGSALAGRYRAAPGGAARSVRRGRSAAIDAIRRISRASVRDPGARFTSISGSRRSAERDPGANIDADVDVLLAGDVVLHRTHRRPSMRFPAAPSASASVFSSVTAVADSCLAVAIRPALLVRVPRRRSRS